MTWARISDPLTVQFAEILYEKRTGKDLKKGKNWLKFENLLRILYQSETEKATVAHRLTQ